MKIKFGAYAIKWTKSNPDVHTGAHGEVQAEGGSRRRHHPRSRDFPDGCTLFGLRQHHRAEHLFGRLHRGRHLSRHDQKWGVG